MCFIANGNLDEKKFDGELCINEEGQAKFEPMILISGLKESEMLVSFNSFANIHGPIYCFVENENKKEVHYIIKG